MTDRTTIANATPASMPPPVLLPDNQDQTATDEDWEKSQDETSPDIEKAQGDDAPVAAQKKDQFSVEFDGPNDLDNPKSWTPARRWAITASMGSMVFTVTFASSIFSVNIAVVQEKFNVELVTATLGVALFVLVRQSFSSVRHYTCS
jgi:DHA1 family multidrug resistance protein-like MFS transporter